MGNNKRITGRKRLGLAVIGILLAGSASAQQPVEPPFIGAYRDVHPQMVTELFLLPDQRFCQRLRTPPVDLVVGGHWQSTDLYNGYHLSLQAESPYPSPYVLWASNDDPVSGKPFPRARRLTVDGQSFAGIGENTVLFGWSNRPALPDNLAPLFAPESRPEAIGGVFELDLPHSARYVFFAEGSAESGYRISQFDTGDQPYLWLRLEPGAWIRHAPMSAMFHHGHLQMQGTDFGEPAPIEAEQRRHLERDCLNPKPADAPAPFVPQAEEYRSRLPVTNRQAAPRFWIQPAAGR